MYDYQFIHFVIILNYFGECKRDLVKRFIWHEFTGERDAHVSKCCQEFAGADMIAAAAAAGGGEHTEELHGGVPEKNIDIYHLWHWYITSDLWMERSAGVAEVDPNIEHI